LHLSLGSQPGPTFFVRRVIKNFSLLCLRTLTRTGSGRFSRLDRCPEIDDKLPIQHSIQRHRGTTAIESGNALKRQSIAELVLVGRRKGNSIKRSLVTSVSNVIRPALKIIDTLAFRFPSDSPRPGTIFFVIARPLVHDCRSVGVPIWRSFIVKLRNPFQHSR
jgi:hypothetical protein